MLPIEVLKWAYNPFGSAAAGAAAGAAVGGAAGGAAGAGVWAVCANAATPVTIIDNSNLDITCLHKNRKPRPHSNPICAARLCQPAWLFLQLGLQLAIGFFVVVGLHAHAVFEVQFAGASGFALERTVEQQGRFRIVGSTVQGSAEALRGGGVLPGPPFGVAEVEAIVGIGVVALERFLKARNCRRVIVELRLGGAQIIEHLVERHGARHQFERVLGAGIVVELVA